MASTVPEAFDVLSSNLEITDLQGETVSTRQENVRKVLDAGLDVLDSFLAGSYKRNTMIAPLKEADVDIFAVLNAQYWHEHTPASLLDKVKSVLRETYTQTPDISRNGQAVTVVFTDFRVDVVPCFHRKDGGFLIPDSQRGVWIGTDPRKHLDIWTAANKAHDGEFVPLVKMLKGWNKTRNIFRSFHLETLALRVFENVTISSAPSGVRYFFDKARAFIKVKLADPAGYSEDVGAYLSTQEQMDKAIERLAWAHDRAVEAEALESQGDEKGAIDKWWTIFKDYFPAYD